MASAETTTTATKAIVKCQNNKLCILLGEWLVLEYHTDGAGTTTVSVVAFSLINWAGWDLVKPIVTILKEKSQNGTMAQWNDSLDDFSGMKTTDWCLLAP